MVPERDESAPPARRRLTVRGTVQGVGFRPFIHALAVEMSLAGSVRNTPAGVLIEAEGPAGMLDALPGRIRSAHPPLAVVESIEVQDLAPLGLSGFAIAPSGGAGAGARVAPDAATCSRCLAEMRDPRSRRAGHAFISCTDCGPRFTIALGLPFDRENTTMAPFAMCDACRREYEDPPDRRFHAQTIACPDCGPRLWLESAAGNGAAGEETLAAARAALAEGAILAVKGIGGWHLACDAASEAAVGRLRERKGRGEKPFAVMARDLEVARRLGRLTGTAARMLSSPAAPIVLAPALPDASLARSVAPGSSLSGLLLPYTPVHHLLFAGAPFRALVMTSGNLSDEPIVTADEDARVRLAPIADLWLGHDREIAAPCDDSVLRARTGAPVPVRRARGWVPSALAVPHAGPGAQTVLAVGGDVKCAPALAGEGRVILGQHVGDLDGPGALDCLDRAVAGLQRVTGTTAQQIACDPHPAYRGASWARRTCASAGMRAPLAVQHHHAHVASVMAEHGLDGRERVLGIAFDGTGYGVPDGTIWGGELLIADYSGFRRAGHLSPVPLPGGESAIRRPARIALAHLHAAGIDWDGRLPCVAACEERERRVLARMLDTGAGCTTATSAGRLFDAVAALAGVRQDCTFEGQAAIELEAAAVRGGPAAEPYTFGISDGRPLLLDSTPMLRQAAAEVLDGAGAEHVGARFHAGLAAFGARAAAALAAQARLTTVVLSGGVFANVLLLEQITEHLQAAGLRVLAHTQVPPNDGGLALGQAAVALAAGRESGPR